MCLGSRAEIVDASINRSRLWNHFKVLKLTINMRLMSHNQSYEKNQSAKAFSEFLLRLGEGKEKYFEDIDLSTDNILLPEELCVKLTPTELIELIYPNLSTQ